VTARVLVTGATTPLGRGLLAELLADEGTERVLAVGIEPEHGLGSDPRLEYHRVDLTRPRALRALLYGPARDAAVDTVIHTARHRRAHDGGRRVRRLNVEATRGLLRACEGHPTVERFVFRSGSEVYAVRAHLPDLVREDQPLNLGSDLPQWVRDRVEADVAVSTRSGLSRLRIVVLRFAEIFAADTGSQLFDYLRSRVCLRPMGYDPMLNLVSIPDAARALTLAARRPDAQGVFNIPGADTLPLSRLIERVERVDVPLPGPVLGPLYVARALTRGTDFRYDLNRWRFHFSALPDGAHARAALGYEPVHPIDWAVPRL
jgi:nucleoside-diphosphate-sugar epimerase